MFFWLSCRQAGLKHIEVHLSLSPRCWYSRHMQPHPTQISLLRSVCTYILDDHVWCLFTISGPSEANLFAYTITTNLSAYWKYVFMGEGVCFETGWPWTQSSNLSAGITGLPHNAWIFFFKLKFLFSWGIEPRTLHMLGKFPPTELSTQQGLLFWPVSETSLCRLLVISSSVV